MGRTTLVVILVVALSANISVWTVIKSHRAKANTGSVHALAESSKPEEIIKSTTRLVHHGRVIAIESLLTAKHSVNLMFDAVIDAL